MKTYKEILNEESSVLKNKTGKELVDLVTKYVEKEAKTQGFYGQFLQNILKDKKKSSEFFDKLEKENLNTFDELDAFLSKNKYFRNS